MVLHNELDAWDEMHKKRKENKSSRELRTSRKFRSCMDGKGFSNTGRLMFSVLEVQVGKLSNTKTSKKLERLMRKVLWKRGKWKSTTRQNSDKHRETND